MLIQCLIVGVGGFIGSVLRFIIENLVNSNFTFMDFPLGTFTVNILGCYFIGFLFGLIAVTEIIGPKNRLFLITGFLGGLTTFSLFNLENFIFINKVESIIAITNTFLQVIIGIFAVWLGYITALYILKSLMLLRSKFSS